jgi:hypothetical protein
LKDSSIEQTSSALMNDIEEEEDKKEIIEFKTEDKLEVS